MYSSPTSAPSDALSYNASFNPASIPDSADTFVLEAPTTSKSPRRKARKLPTYLSQLDGLRFVAVTLVLIDHWLAERNSLPMGPLGVTIFFVLSGFLISRILLSNKEKVQAQQGTLWTYLKTFYIRRTLRIFPLYYLVILGLVLTNTPPVRETLGWCLLYATNLYIAFKGTWMGSIDHFWSLAVEEQVYLFFPVLLFFVPRRHVVLTMLLLITGGVASRYVFFQTGQPWMVGYVSTIGCLDAFGLGGLLAYLYLYEPDWFVRLFQTSKLVLVAVLAYTICVAYGKTFPTVHNIQTDVWERLMGSLLGAALVGRAAIGFKGGIRSLLENGVVRYLGQISYGLYVFHNFIYNYYHTPETHPTLRLWTKVTAFFPAGADLIVLKMLFLYTLTAAVASLSWFLLEKPINSLKDRFNY